MSHTRSQNSYACGQLCVSGARSPDARFVYTMLVRPYSQPLDCDDLHVCAITASKVLTVAAKFLRSNFDRLLYVRTPVSGIFKKKSLYSTVPARL